MQKKVILFATGGTIASLPGADGRNISGALPGEALVKTLDLPESVEVEICSLFQKPSNAITLDDLLILRAECLARIQQKEVSGIVITHGTDTLEETAYFLESTLEPDPVPVIVTGSQRVPHAQGTDAFTNLRQSIIAALSPALQGLGVVVVFNESIYSANTVRKVNSYQLNAFMSPGYGCLGYIDNDAVRIQQRPVRAPVINPGHKLDRVDIICAYLGASPDLIYASVHSGARGIVIEAVGRGHVPPEWMESIHWAIQSDVTVLICTTCLFGPVHQSYEYRGSLYELECAGAIAVGDLDARKARLRLLACLSQPDNTPDTIRKAFEVFQNKSVPL